MKLATSFAILAILASTPSFGLPFPQDGDSLDTNDKRCELDTCAIVGGAKTFATGGGGSPIQGVTPPTTDSAKGPVLQLVPTGDGAKQDGSTVVQALAGDITGQNGPLDGVDGAKLLATGGSGGGAGKDNGEPILQLLPPGDTATSGGSAVVQAVSDKASEEGAEILPFQGDGKKLLAVNAAGEKVVAALPIGAAEETVGGSSPDASKVINDGAAKISETADPIANHLGPVLTNETNKPITGLPVTAQSNHGAIVEPSGTETPESPLPADGEFAAPAFRLSKPVTQAADPSEVVDDQGMPDADLQSVKLPGGGEKAEAKPENGAPIAPIADGANGLKEGVTGNPGVPLLAQSESTSQGAPQEQQQQQQEPSPSAPAPSSEPSAEPSSAQSTTPPSPSSAAPPASSQQSPDPEASAKVTTPQLTVHDSPLGGLGANKVAAPVIDEGKADANKFGIQNVPASFADTTRPIVSDVKDGDIGSDNVLGATEIQGVQPIDQAKEGVKTLEAEEADVDIGKPDLKAVKPPQAGQTASDAVTGIATTNGIKDNASPITDGVAHVTSDPSTPVGDALKGAKIVNADGTVAVPAGGEAKDGIAQILAEGAPKGVEPVVESVKTNNNGDSNPLQEGVAKVKGVTDGSNPVEPVVGAAVGNPSLKAANTQDLPINTDNLGEEIAGDLPKKCKECIDGDLAEVTGAGETVKNVAAPEAEDVQSTHTFTGAKNLASDLKYASTPVSEIPSNCVPCDGDLQRGAAESVDLCAHQDNIQSIPDNTQVCPDEMQSLPKVVTKRDENDEDWNVLERRGTPLVRLCTVVAALR